MTVLQVEWKKKIVSRETLIFIDEIQNSPNLLKLLRFIYEEKPELYVIVAGSFLEAKIKKEGFSFPVGRVEFCYLYPLDFFEYLKAKEKNELLELLGETDFDRSPFKAIHELALKNFMNMLW